MVHNEERIQIGLLMANCHDFVIRKFGQNSNSKLTFRFVVHGQNEKDTRDEKKKERRKRKKEGERNLASINCKYQVIKRWREKQGKRETNIQTEKKRKRMIRKMKLNLNQIDAED